VEHIESCNSLWLLDSTIMQFCRLPRGTDPAYAVSAPWQRYYAWEDDPGTGAFRVALDARRTRWLASWRHIEPCARCSEERTREVVMPPPGTVVAGTSPPRGTPAD
jgi:hypothetical protein